MHPKSPVIAAVNGPAIGAGFDLVNMCDIRIGSTHAQFGETFVNLGIMAGDGGGWFLQRVGRRTARRRAHVHRAHRQGRGGAGARHPAGSHRARPAAAARAGDRRARSRPSRRSPCATPSARCGSRSTRGSKSTWSPAPPSRRRCRRPRTTSRPWPRSSKNAAAYSRGNDARIRLPPAAAFWSWRAFAAAAARPGAQARAGGRGARRTLSWASFKNRLLDCGGEARPEVRAGHTRPQRAQRRRRRARHRGIPEAVGRSTPTTARSGASSPSALFLGAAYHRARGPAARAVRAVPARRSGRGTWTRTHNGAIIAQDALVKAGPILGLADARHAFVRHRPGRRLGSRRQGAGFQAEVGQGHAQDGRGLRARRADPQPDRARRLLHQDRERLAHDGVFAPAGG